jgi:hypothetical protein
MNNGNGRLWTAIWVTVLLACVVGAYQVGAHIGNRAIHQNIAEKQQLTRTIIDREITPLFREIQRRLTNLEHAQDERERDRVGD